MTSILFQDFDERSKEVSKYFLFLKNLEQNSIQLSMKSLKGNAKIKSIDSELLKTLKASGFLLLYNLVEATMRNAIEAIFDELQSKGVSYDLVRPELKKIVLKNFKKRSLDKLFSSIKSISLDIIAVGFDEQELFSGNVDGRLIKDIARAPVQYSRSSILGDLIEPRQNMEVMNYCHSPQVEQVFAQRTIACPFSLPLSNMS